MVMEPTTRAVLYIHPQQLPIHQADGLHVASLTTHSLEHQTPLVMAKRHGGLGRDSSSDLMAKAVFRPPSHANPSSLYPGKSRIVGSSLVPVRLPTDIRLQFEETGYLFTNIAKKINVHMWDFWAVYHRMNIFFTSLKCMQTLAINVSHLLPFGLLNS